jgi:hypothetical protein
VQKSQWGIDALSSLTQEKRQMVSYSQMC